jgi:hypothetical protein
VPACGLDVGGALTERFQVLPAEHSAKVAQEGEDERSFAPEF